MIGIYSFAGLIAVLFFIVKFVEMRFDENSDKSVKELVKNSIIVYICVVVANFVATAAFSSEGTNSSNVKHATEAFTDNPDF